MQNAPPLGFFYEPMLLTSDFGVGLLVGKSGLSKHSDPAKLRPLEDFGNPHLLFIPRTFLV